MPDTLSVITNVTDGAEINSSIDQGVSITSTVIESTTVTANVVAGGKGDAGTNGVGVPTGGTSGQVLKKNSGTDFDTSWTTISGTGTVTSVSITTANGVSGSVANSTTTPAISLLLGAITPTSVVASGSVTGSNLSGTNTGDQDLSTYYHTGGTDVAVADGGTGVSTLTGIVKGNGTSPFTAATAGTDYTTPSSTETVTNKNLTSGTNTFPTFNQSTTGSAAKWTTARNLAGNSVDGSANVAFANKFIVQGTADAGLSGAQFLGALGTGIVKNTTTTGVLSIAIAADFPTLNQNTTGSAATLTTSRNIGGVAFNGSADISLTSGSSILKGNGSGGFSNASAGTDYYNPGGTDVAITDGGTGVSTLPSGLLKGAGTGAITAGVAGTDYQAPITLTTTGTSGAATLISNTLNIPQYTGGGGSGITRSVNSISTTTTAGSTSSTDYVYICTSTFTLTLPTAVGNTNRYTVKNAGIGVITVATTSAQTIDGSSTASLPVQNTSIDLVSDGTNWTVI